MVVLVIISIGFSGAFISMGEPSFERAADVLASGSMIVTLLGIACVAVVLTIVLDLLKNFADRACMLEDTTVFDSYGRGWQVIRDNFGEVFVLFLLRIAIGIVLFLFLFMPSMFLACLCCIGWIALLLINGAIEAYYSTVWTLGWREWTGKGSDLPVIEQAPSV